MTILSVAALAVLIVLSACTAESTSDSVGSQVETHSTPPGLVGRAAAASDLLVTGNTFWGRRIDAAARASDLGVRLPFSRLGELHRDRYDAWITGLECPTVPGVRPSRHEQEKLLVFNCDPAYLEEAARWFDVVSLANNHTDNQGRDGVDATRDELDKHGILHFGDPDPKNLERVCKVVPVAARVRGSDGEPTEGHLPLGLCGFHGVFEIPPASALEVMERLSVHVPVLALPHSGLEYVAHERGIKVELYRSMIDHGADAVLGDHAHWVQNSEVWHGRPIVYSMGNFMFDQQRNAEVTRSAAIQVRLTLDDQPGLDAWLDLGERCAHLTDCTSLVENAGLRQPKTRFSFGVVGTTNAGGLTRAASAAQTAAILDRLKWNRTMQGLSGLYGPIEGSESD